MKKENSFSKKIIEQIGINVIVKGFSIILSFFFIPLSISYLGSENYGIWLTLFSFLSFFTFFDFGIGHGLRNNLTTALSKNKIILAKEYVSTTYITLLVISICLSSIFILFFNLIDWQSIFKFNSVESQNFILIIKIIYICFFFNLTFKCIDIISYSNHKSSFPGILIFINSLCSFTIIYILNNLESNSIVYYGYTIAFTQIMTYVIANIFLFRFKFNTIKPNFKSFKKKHLKKIFGLGMNFFLIQICAVILFSSDNLIITQIFSPDQVTVYNIPYKFFGIFKVGTSLILIPLWSAFTTAITKNDIIWIKNTINKSLIFVTLISVIVLISMFFANEIFALWIGNNITIPNELNIIMGIYIICTMYLQVFSMFLNGSSKIKIQLYSGTLSAIINIPLSIYFAKRLNFGLSGVIMATLATNILSLILFVIQYTKIINNKATGIWNK
ncbi:hypothetical protein EI427_04690 [Flammeovirga pectinis]|uniref:Polysaccharide biosynthesis protein C-terminal domain-containing protein n=1 Tax=Flammeovirga pectinis TaxID=2494373 RepID=A0A3Q9FP94_9BACT|nr:oligosaccharide flippase family protein [Flammeovirga pectinis]AZQ61550.1 hypothetical protein EI427_04690 [Flammeovirga pectinis]